MTSYLNITKQLVPRKKMEKKEKKKELSIQNNEGVEQSVLSTEEGSRHHSNAKMLHISIYFILYIEIKLTYFFMNGLFCTNILIFHLLKM